MAGANHLKILIDDYRRKKMMSYAYKTGKIFSKCHFLVELPINYKNKKKNYTKRNKF